MAETQHLRRHLPIADGPRGQWNPPPEGPPPAAVAPVLAIVPVAAPPAPPAPPIPGWGDALAAPITRAFRGVVDGFEAGRSAPIFMMTELGGDVERHLTLLRALSVPSAVYGSVYGLIHGAREGFSVLGAKISAAIG